MLKPWVFLNGRIVPAQKALIHGLDPGFLWGQGLFETMRCCRGTVFAIERHFARLRHSCPVMGLKPLSWHEMEKAVKMVVQANRLREAAVRLNYFKTRQGCGLLVFSRRYQPPAARGFSACVWKDGVFVRGPLSGVKSLNHFFYQSLGEQGRRQGFDEIFFLNEAGEVVEGARTNLFIVRKGRILTPALGCGCLPGVTRQIIKDLCAAEKIAVKEDRILPGELNKADEIFVTNAVVGVMAVTTLDSRPVGAGHKGVFTRLIMRLYQNEVEKVCFLK